jgi:hypothetical protein
MPHSEYHEILSTLTKGTLFYPPTSKIPQIEICIKTKSKLSINTVQYMRILNLNQIQ